MPIGLRYHAPSPSLRSIVSSYYMFHADMPYYADLMRADLPQIRFMLSGSADYHFHDGAVMPAPSVTLTGPTFGAYRFETTGPLLVFGIGLLPAGWAALIREDASIHANRVGDAGALFGRAIADAHDQLRGVTKLGDMARIADRLISTLLMRVPEPPLWITRLTDDWLTCRPSPQVNALVETVGMSNRQIERLVKRIYGASPKMLARKYRALKAASELARGQLTWSEVAGEAFSDQSHFIREFRQFIGLTPTQLVVNPPPATRLTFERRGLNSAFPDLTKIT
jgi:AraC-like DNA-binding protein